MKPKSIKSLLALALLAPGALFAQTTAKTTPVGYETLPVSTGFNYLGLRLHQPVLFSGVFDSQTTTSLTDAQGDFSTVVSSKLYILELENGKIAELPGTALASGTISGLTGIVVGDLVKYSIRESATLASIFGAANSAGLAAGTFGPSGADQVWVPNGSGDFNKYYFDSFNANSSTATWSEVDGSNAAVDAAAINLVYLDGIIIVKDSASTLTNVVVSGAVKTTKSSVGVPVGFNYLSSLYPAGATLATTFGAANTAGLSAGTFGPSGADQVWVPNGTGDFNKYYFDSFNANSSTATWSEVDGSNAAVDAALINLTSGVLIVADSAKNVEFTAPSFYSTL